MNSQRTLVAASLACDGDKTERHASYAKRKPVPQHLSALAHANEIRVARGLLKKQVLAGTVQVVDVLRNPPPEAVTMTVRDLLASKKGWGPLKTRGFLAKVRVGEGRKVGELTDRQREVLAEQLRFGLVSGWRDAA